LCGECDLPEAIERLRAEYPGETIRLITKSEAERLSEEVE
jgi:hypothetical protein